ncbi:MAG: flagellar hook-basal body complex protein [Pseudomonadota bacterium]
MYDLQESAYISLARQVGLSRELGNIANNIANVSTVGFRTEKVIFAERIHRDQRPFPAVSIAHVHGRAISDAPGQLEKTDGLFDLAIDGNGYFLVSTPNGNALTRAGHFLPNQDGELVMADGAQLLDITGAGILVPREFTGVAVASDGTLSIDGQPIAQIGVWRPREGTHLPRAAGARFFPENGVELEDSGRLLQGFLENSNVNPILEIARLIEVQHAYTQGQNLLEREDERIRNVIRTLGR